MNKKILTFLVAFVAVFAITFGITACDDNDTNDNTDKTENTDNTGNTDSTGNTENTGDTETSTAIVLTEDTDFSALVSEVVDEAGWQTAFSTDSYTDYTAKIFAKEDEGEYREMMIYSIVKTDELIIGHSFQIYNDGESLNKVDIYEMVDFERGYDYAYVDYNDEGVYYRYTYLLEEMDERAKEGFEWSFQYTSFCPDFSAYYNEFTYNEQTGAYEYYGEEGLDTNYTMEYNENSYMTYNNISLKIINGKLAYIKFNDREHEVEICFYDFDNTTITLPEDYIEKD